MKLVKVCAAVRSFALYGRGSKPAQWQLQTEDGQVLFEVRGKRHDDGRQTYSLYRPGEAAPARRGLAFADVRALVAG